jgi:hypothetical protein
MILLNDVVEVFDPSNLNASVMTFIVAFNRRPVGTALVDGDLLWRAVLFNRLTKETKRRLLIAPGREQEVHRGVGLVDRSIRYFQTLFTFTWVSSSRQLDPAGRLRARKRVCGNRTYLRTQRSNVE